MIFSRAPMRVSFCGGGSDLPAFYEKFGGCVISTAIRKYVYIAIHPAFFKDSITLKYSKTEIVDDVNQIEHKIFKAVLKKYQIKGVEITSMADIPSGTGLGSSSSFTVALLKLIRAYSKQSYSTYAIASEACDIEINKVGSPIGKQDQFASAFGGLNFITFHKNGKVTVEPVTIPNNKEQELENNLLLFYTGLTHDANVILKEQTQNISYDQQKINTQIEICNMTKKLKNHLECGDIDYLGGVLKRTWELKKTLSSAVTNKIIDDIYDKAIKAGASGGKLLGAGGGGFLLFYVKPEHQHDVRIVMASYQEMDFRIDYDGVTIIYGGK